MTDETDPPDSDPSLDDLFSALGEQPTASAVDPKRNREQLTVRAKELAEERQFVRATLATAVGRRVFWSMLQAGHAFETLFAVSPTGMPQPERTWMHLGEQQLTQRYFLGWQRLDPEGVRLMLVEHDPRFAEAKPRKRKAV